MRVSVVIALAADPGLATTGVCAIERRDDGRLHAVHAELLKTEPNRESKFRAAAEDQRRLREQWTAMRDLADRLQPAVMGVETYTVFEPRDAEGIRVAAQGLLSTITSQVSDAEQLRQWLLGDGFKHLLGAAAALKSALAVKSTIPGRGQAAKTVLIYSAVMCIALERDIPCYPFMPLDLKMKIGGRRGASKDEVESAMYARVEGLREMVADAAPRSQRNHITDSAGHALLALEQFERDEIAFRRGRLSRSV